MFCTQDLKVNSNYIKSQLIVITKWVIGANFKNSVGNDLVLRS